MLLATNPQFCGAYCPGLLFPTVINEIPVLFLWYVANLLAFCLLHILKRRERSFERWAMKINKHHLGDCLFFCGITFTLMEQHFRFWQLSFRAGMLTFQFQKKSMEKHWDTTKTLLVEVYSKEIFDKDATKFLLRNTKVLLPKICFLVHFHNSTVEFWYSFQRQF